MIKDQTWIFDVERLTVECWFNPWELEGVNSHSIISGRGVKTRLNGFEEVIKLEI